MAEWQPTILALNSFEVKTCNPHIEEFSGSPEERSGDKM